MLTFDIDARTPMQPNYNNSPEMEYFKTALSARQRTSRWKEDWEELELLVSVSLDDISQLNAASVGQGRFRFGRESAQSH